jgi:hypothetical protein
MPDTRPPRRSGTAAEQRHPRIIGRPFEKGQSGNPGGRPEGLSITAAVRRELAEVADLLVARTVMGEGDAERWEAAALTKADVVAARVVAMASTATSTRLSSSGPTSTASRRRASM